MLNTTEERHEKSHIKKFPDPDGQESILLVCSSVLIVDLFAFVQYLLIGTIIHNRSKSTKKSGYRG